MTTAFRATDRLSPAFNQMGRAADRFGAHGSAAMSRMHAAAASVRGAIMGMMPFVGIALVGQLAVRAVNLASALTEVQNVVDVTFGSSAGQIDTWAKSAMRNFGLSELQAKQFTGSLGAMMRSSGIASGELVNMSTSLSGLAGDFASFYNLDIEDAFDKIRSGISGETEPLKRLGINMSVANLQAYALTQGIRKQWTQMTQAEQVQLRYNYLMSVSTSAQGDFNRTLATSYANQKRVLGVQFDQFLARIATAILPLLTSAFTRLNEIMGAIDTAPIADGLKTIAEVLPYIAVGFIAYRGALMGVAFWQAAVVAIGWIKYLSMMMPIMRSAIAAQGIWNFLLGGTAIQSGLAAIATGALSVWQGIQSAATWVATTAQWALNAAFLACPITWIILGIIALVAVGVLLYRNWDVVKVKFMSAMSAIWDGIKMVGRGIMTGLMFPVNLLIAGILKLLEIASKIPGVGATFASAAESVRQFQANANAATGATNYFAPNAAQTAGANVSQNVTVNASQGVQASVTASNRGGARQATRSVGAN